MAAPRPRRWHWRGFALQALIVLGLLALLAWLLQATADNLHRHGIPSGFDFLREPAGFAIGEGLLAFEPAMPYWRAFVAGLANTLRVALPAMAAAALLGGLLGLARTARSPLLAGFGAAYVELFRNLPLLLQLLAWYALLTEFLPAADAPWQALPGLALSKSGLALALGDGATIWLTPEFLTVFLGLSLYTAAYLAECVRAGILAVPEGQKAAAAALGLSPGQAFRHVVLPQAARIFLPPATNQLLNLLKNSSLAVAVGYPDLVSVANTSLNQTGRAAECIAIVLAVFTLASLVVALASRLTHPHPRPPLEGEGACSR